MNSSFEPKTQDQKRRASHDDSQSAIAYPSSTIVHAKLEMTEPGDYYEQEADAVADTVMSGGKIAREISGGSNSSGIAVPRQMESRLMHSQGGGQPMPQGLRSMMEGAFGQDFRQVRIHTDSEAASMSGDIHANAFTFGHDIYFNRGQFAPETTAGQRLVAHELTHVVQGHPLIRREVAPLSAEERQACLDNEVRLANAEEDIEVVRNGALTRFLELKVAFQGAVLSILLDKTSPTLPTSLFFDVAGDVLSLIPYVGSIASGAVKYGKDLLEMEQYRADKLESEAEQAFYSVFRDRFEKVRLKIKTAEETELRKMIQSFAEESCQANLELYYKRLIENKMSLYKEYVQPIGTVDYDCTPGLIDMPCIPSLTGLAYFGNSSQLVLAGATDFKLNYYTIICNLPDDPFIIERAKQQAKEKQGTIPRLYRKATSKSMKSRKLGLNELNELLLRDNSKSTGGSKIVHENRLLTKDQVEALNSVIHNREVIIKEYHMGRSSLYGLPMVYSQNKNTGVWQASMSKDFDDWCKLNGLSEDQKDYLDDVLDDLDVI